MFIVINQLVEVGGEANTYYTSYKWYPNIYAQEKKSGIDTTDVKEDGIGQSDSFYEEPKNETSSQAKEKLTVIQTGYSMTMQNSHYDSDAFFELIHNFAEIYWLASRYVNTIESAAYFGISCVSNKTISFSNIYFSYNGSYFATRSLRPVVSLDSNTILGSGNGESDSAYQIIG